MKLKCGSETIWEMKTTTIENSNNPEWNEAFFADMPMEGGTCYAAMEVLQIE